MKKLLVFLFAAILLFSGCVGQKTIKNDTISNVSGDVVKNGSIVSVDYIASYEDGKIFDTTIESVAKQNDIYAKNKKYQPISFKIGTGKFFKGFDEGVIGMKVGETKTIIMPPEIQIDPSKINIIPIIQSFPIETNMPRIIEIPADQFNAEFGRHSVGDTVQIPDSNINLTVKSIGANVSLAFDLKVGDKMSQKRAPWSQTVVAIDNNSVTIKADAKQNETVIFPDALWNTSVIDVNSTYVTVKHNAIPDKEITSTFGSLNIHFNKTSIIVDQNNKFAGKTLKFEITLKSIS